MSEAAASSDSVTDQIRDILADSAQLGEGDRAEGGRADDAAAAQRGDGPDGAVDTANGQAADDLEAAPEGSEEADTATADDAASGSDAGADDAPVSLKDIAKELGLEAAELYDLQIPIGGGETVDLGTLKDLYRETGPIREAREQIDAQRREMDQEKMATRQELHAILQVIPPQIRNQVIEAASQFQDMTETRAREETLKAIPEWKDADVRAKDRDAILEAAGKYGFTEAEVAYTTDPRMFMWMRDHIKLLEAERQRTAALEEKRAAPGKPAKTKTRRLTQRRLAQVLQKARASTDPADKTAAISMLIGSQT